MLVEFLGSLPLFFLSSSFLLSSLISLFHSPFVLLLSGDDDNLCSLWFNVPKYLARDGGLRFPLVHPGAGVSSICHVARKGEKGSSPRDKSRSGEMKTADLFRMLNSRFDKQEKRFKRMDSRSEAFQQGKSGGLKGIATEAGAISTTPPEPQQQQQLLPSQSPWLLPQPSVLPQSSMSQPPPPLWQPPSLQHYLHSAPSMIGTLNHRSSTGAGARGVVPADESLAGIPWKLNPPVFSGDSAHFCCFEK